MKVLELPWRPGGSQAWGSQQGQPVAPDGRGGGGRACTTGVILSSHTPSAFDVFARLSSHQPPGFQFVDGDGGPASFRLYSWYLDGLEPELRTSLHATMPPCRASP